MPSRPRRGARCAAATLAACAVVAEAVGGVGAMEDGGGEEHAREDERIPPDITTTARAGHMAPGDL